MENGNKYIEPSWTTEEISLDPEERPKKVWNVLSLGAGVQSSCIALMSEKGDLPPLDFAVFADTGAEPQEVYDWLNWLEKQLSFPVHRVFKGDLTKDSLAINYRKTDGTEYIKSIIPKFGLMPDGTVVGAIGRACTSDYKIRPILKKVKDVCGVKRGQKEITVRQWIGISSDEMQRMKMSRDKWAENWWPLVDKKMNRTHCKQWMEENGFPEPPESSCYYCPFHRDELWRDLRDNKPDEFKKAIKFDKDLREACKIDKKLKMEVFLHRSCKPLGEVDFDNDIDKGQMVMFEGDGGYKEIVTKMDFSSECEGMCGI